VVVFAPRGLLRTDAGRRSCLPSAHFPRPSTPDEQGGQVLVYMKCSVTTLLVCLCANCAFIHSNHFLPGRWNMGVHDPVTAPAIRSQRPLRGSAHAYPARDRWARLWAVEIVGQPDRARGSNTPTVRLLHKHAATGRRQDLRSKSGSAHPTREQWPYHPRMRSELNQFPSASTCNLSELTRTPNFSQYVESAPRSARAGTQDP
jgi:hypothetical protein